MAMEPEKQPPATPPATGLDDKVEDDTTVEKQYPPTRKVIPAMLAVYLVFFLVALDRTIIGTAIPSISAEFNSFSDIAWYESAFLLPLCVLQLSFGLVYKYYTTRWVLLSLAFIFELGSIVCAAAPTSNAFIIGRAITGIGGAGISTGAFLIVTQLVPLRSRPKFIGSLGSAFGISSILGPILGGYLTSVTWRWCFWINVPIGALSLVLLLLLAPTTPPADKAADTWRGRISQLDPFGFLLIAPTVICFLFALEFGGQDKNWSEGRVIALFVLFGVFGIAFIAYQAWRGEKGTVPPRIVLKQSVWVSCLLAFFIGAVLVLYSFYLPIWFQVVQARSPQDSGIALLPYLLSVVVAVVCSGILVSKIGYYTPVAFVGAAIVVAGSAAITTWSPHITTCQQVGYQILAGIGIGLSLQQPNIAVQTVLSESDAPIGLSILSFVLSFGGSAFITIAQTLLEGQLRAKLAPVVPNVDINRLAGSGAGSLKDYVPPENLEAALSAYNDSMKVIWYLLLGLGAAGFLTAFGLEWKSVKGEKKTKDDEEDLSAEKP